MLCYVLVGLYNVAQLIFLNLVFFWINAPADCFRKCVGLLIKMQPFLFYCCTEPLKRFEKKFPDQPPAESLLQSSLSEKQVNYFWHIECLTFINNYMRSRIHYRSRNCYLPYDILSECTDFLCTQCCPHVPIALYPMLSNTSNTLASRSMF